MHYPDELRKMASRNGMDFSLLKKAFNDVMFYIKDGMKGSAVTKLMEEDPKSLEEAQAAVALELVKERLEMVRELVKSGVPFKDAWKGTAVTQRVALDKTNKFVAETSKKLGRSAGKATGAAAKAAGKAALKAAVKAITK